MAAILKEPVEAHFRDVLRGDVAAMAAWSVSPRHLGTRILPVIVVGAGLYGATVGLWRSPLQSLYVGIKFPLMILLTVAGTALASGILAQGLGLRVGFRASAGAILVSFAITSVILGSLSPVILFLLLNAPPLESPEARTVYRLILLSHVGCIGIAGAIGTTRLFRLLVHWTGATRIAARVLMAWLALNLFVGSQLGWIARPFIGTPRLPVQFLRPNAFKGNFYESVIRSTQHLANLPKGDPHE